MYNLKEKIKNNKEHIIYIIAVITFILVMVSAIYTIRQLYIEINGSNAVNTMALVTASPEPPAKKIITVTPEPPAVKSSPKLKESPVPGNIEEEIFTYLQGPRSWKKRLEWSGQWGTEFYNGGSFGGFGCGLCCLANVYSTKSKYQCTPVDMYRFAKRRTGYSGGGAIAWEYMDTALNKLGFSTELKRKPGSYRAFKKQIAEAGCSIVLISSNNSKCYWKNTPGHYVTIFLYDEKTDTVFLADSGNPEHNRQRIELKKIYKSLKTESQWQYLNVGSYKSTSDIWKHKKLNGNWVQPGYIQ